jgi:hypothetical protein
VTDGCPTSPGGKFWNEFTTEERNAALLVGYTMALWDAGDRAPFKVSWADMTEEQHCAAALLGFPPEQFKAPKKARGQDSGKPWSNHDGWTLSRGTGLTTWIFTAPGGNVFTEEKEALAFEALGNAGWTEAAGTNRKKARPPLEANKTEKKTQKVPETKPPAPADAPDAPADSAADMHAGDAPLTQQLAQPAAAETCSGTGLSPQNDHAPPPPPITSPRAGEWPIVHPPHSLRSAACWSSLGCTLDQARRRMVASTGPR